MIEQLGLKIVTRDETVALMDWPGLIASAEEAYVASSEGRAAEPKYINMPIGERGNFAHFKTGYGLDGEIFVLKYSGGFWHELPDDAETDSGYVMVHRASDGKPLVLFLDNDEITNHRTAAAGAVAAKHVARKDSRVVGVVGTGIQAHLQVEVLREVMPGIEIVRVWGRNAKKAANYVREMESKIPGVKFESMSEIEQVVRGSDILITATASQEPLVQASWVEPGLHITAVGACSPVMQELEPEILAKADLLYVDSLEKCGVDGELHHGLEAGVISKKDVTGELGELIGGEIAKRVNDEQITVVDLVGLGIQDYFAAKYLLGKMD